jgi:subtilisin family serine protease
VDDDVRGEVGHELVDALPVVRLDAVELAAPGVSVVSTTPFAPSSLSVGSTTWFGGNIDGSARSNAGGTLVDGGLCGTAGAWSGKVVLCERGTYTFAEKVSAVKNGGGAGAVIYNNVSGGFAGTLNGTSSIPAIGISQEDGAAAKAVLGSAATLTNAGGAGNGYESYDGTSMATPHVSGVAALVWSYFPDRTNAQVRTALQQTALDKGAAGRDTSYGYGIVQAKAAYDYLLSPPVSLSVTKVRSAGKNYAELRWTGLPSDQNGNVTYYRNSAGTATPNDGVHRDGPVSAGTYIYRVCATNGTCTSYVSITF